MNKRVCIIGLFLLLSSWIWPARADTITVAVAANFAPVVEQLSPKFTRKTGHQLRIVIGSTGKLAAQILNGAPFDVFLSADSARIDRLIELGVGDAKSRITYAFGVLVVLSHDSLRIEPSKQTLVRGAFRHLAIANPKLAPYGLAARQVLEGLALDRIFANKTVLGQSVGQVFSLVSTGNAELGFVALSQVLASKGGSGKSVWKVPEQLYAPIRQDGLRLKRSKLAIAGDEFLKFLKDRETQAAIVAAGYKVAK